MQRIDQEKLHDENRHRRLPNLRSEAHSREGVENRERADEQRTQRDPQHRLASQFTDVGGQAESAEQGKHADGENNQRFSRNCLEKSAVRFHASIAASVAVTIANAGLLAASLSLRRFSCLLRGGRRLLLDCVPLWPRPSRRTGPLFLCRLVSRTSPRSCIG